MIIWGGFTGTDVNTGGTYEPVSDTWTATTTVNAPSAREYHTAVWSGTRMIIWGGRISTTGLNSGGIYDPAADTWIATSTSNVPAARSLHTAIWTDSKMIIWGGYFTTTYNTGGVYSNSAVTSINYSGSGNPRNFALLQNYPNPFNPATNIEFQIPKAGIVKLAIYDILGKEIETVVNEQMQAGNYKIEYDGSKLSSGIYLYQIRAEQFVETKRMILIK